MVKMRSIFGGPLREPYPVYINPDTGCSNDPYDNDGIFSVNHRHVEPLSPGSQKIEEAKKKRLLEAARGLIERCDPTGRNLDVDEVVKALDIAKYGEKVGRLRFPDGRPAIDPLAFGVRYEIITANPTALEDVEIWCCKVVSSRVSAKHGYPSPPEPSLTEGGVMYGNY